MTPADAEEYTQALGQVVSGGWRQIALGQRLGVPKALGLTVGDWVQQRLGGYVKYSIAERRQAVAELKADDKSSREIGEILGVDHKTVLNDLGGEKSPAPTVDHPMQSPATGENSPTYPIDTITALAVDADLRQAVETKATREQREEQREERRDANAAKVVAVSDPRELLKIGRFSTIVIDPPWDFGDEGDINIMGRAKHDYASMSIDEILLLPVDTLADVDCHLYLWITNRSLPKGFRLLEAWGFRYITCLTWVKPSYGMGNYFRGQTEQVLFGIKGSQPLKRKDVGTVLRAARGPAGHSSKPAEFYDLVESCSPHPYLELFSRQQRSGWTAWGESGVMDGELRV